MSPQYWMVCAALGGAFCWWNQNPFHRFKWGALSCDWYWKSICRNRAHRRLLKYKAITVSNAETRKEVCLDCGVETGQRIMMVISSKPKQSHPLIPHSLPAPVYVCVSLSALNPPTRSLSPSLSLPPHRTHHILTGPIFSLCLSYNLKLISHYLRWIQTHTISNLSRPWWLLAENRGLFMQMPDCTPIRNVNSCTPGWPYFITGVSKSACRQLWTFVLMSFFSPHFSWVCGAETEGIFTFQW